MQKFYHISHPNSILYIAQKTGAIFVQYNEKQAGSNDRCPPG